MKNLSQHLIFPKGLVQPQRGYRFSIDSLLLISFVKPKKQQMILDLGTGCGVLGIGLLLMYEDLKVFGIELDKSMIECAKKNIKNFGFEKKFFLIMEDVRLFRPKVSIFEIVVVNPPYRFIGEGRISPFEGKKVACFNIYASPEDFIKTAFYSLKNKGDLYLIFPAEKLSYLFHALELFRFEAKKIRFIHPRKEKEASLVLLKAKKNGNPGIIVEPPIILYKDKNNTPTEELLNFCPFLR